MPQPQTFRAILSKGIKTPKLNRWSMQLADYNITLMHIKGKHNILADAICRLKMLNIYKVPLENPNIQVVNNMQQVVTEVYATSMHTIGIDTLCYEKKGDNMSKELALPICHSDKNSSRSFNLFADGVLPKYQYTSPFMICNMM